MAINGNNLFISVGSATTPFAGTRSNQITVNAETIEISSPMQGEWREFIKGRKEWSVNIDWLVLTANDSSMLLEVDKTYTLNWQDRSTTYLTGTAILTDCDISAPRGGVVKGVLTFKGTGPLAAPSSQ